MNSPKLDVAAWQRRVRVGKGCLGLAVLLDVLNDEASIVDDDCGLGVVVLESSTAPLLKLA